VEALGCRLSGVSGVSGVAPPHWTLGWEGVGLQQGPFPRRRRHREDAFARSRRLLPRDDRREDSLYLCPRGQALPPAAPSRADAGQPLERKERQPGGEPGVEYPQREHSALPPRPRSRLSRGEAGEEVRCREVGSTGEWRVFESVNEAARELGISRDTVIRACEASA
jgi:hypothetical protein